ncbi:MAG: phospholipase A [Giesbergeria sp.]|nr:phospholipase A [Giesbergeria sp.]MBP6419705.1 phospholipase A [Giesbergeria sp.]
MSRAGVVWAGAGAAAVLLSAAPLPALAQSSHWQACTALAADSAARLACFDQWASQQKTPIPVPPPMDTAQAPPVIEIISPEGCRNPAYSDLSRFWELESGSDCGTFSFRGYRPISVSVTRGSNVNRQPSSGADAHSAATPVDYRRVENRIQLSVRTKIAQGMLTQGDNPRKDSLWFGYTQQSYWQLFSPDISRPFRNTDHEPEVIYVYPTDAALPGGWRLRYSGIGVVHQSNGQSLPLSRSWNRVYLMAGMELGQRWRVQARVWQRIGERSHNDDNPGISDYVGRGELSAFWSYDPDNLVGMTLRHALRSPGRGSARVEWLQTLGTGFAGGKSNLRLHTQLFSGYGDSLIDYNRRRTVFSVGLSLVDF